ncbi:MAG: S-adenosylmethionine:tRNA ribosyltransferase-isomerase, partial [Bacteroidota bacterium]|nr:S-adenosylmethionine:tRNA ribosyltransferase-isomerase [Bacteroidota bacterium]
MEPKNSHPKDIAITSYTYVLPEERIAKFPLPNRDESKLLIYQNQQIEESTYQQLPDHLPENTLLVMNNTKVVEARLRFEKSNGNPIEIFCLEPDAIYPDISSAMLEKGKVSWKCLVGGARKWKEEWIQLRIRKPDDSLLTIKARKTAQQADAFVIELVWDDDTLSFAEVLHFAGQIPLPPYLNRAPEESDKERYQTIYARNDGSVAAPTAGLHFTERLFARLADKHIQKEFITLHVGAGTFKPVKSPTLETHEMHAEFLDVSAHFLEKLLQQTEQNIIAVGTTSLRTLESLYWIGVKTYKNPLCRPADL